MPAKSKAARGELALIELIRNRAQATLRGAGKRVRLGIGDDCAILAPPAGSEVVVTTDFSLEGRHFTRDRHSASSVGHRVLARGLSDLAAMGAAPLAAFLSLALPSSVANDRKWIGGFLDGLTMLARKTHTPLAGGDTSESPGEHVLADIVLLGSVPTGTALRRDGARPGDAIYVTGVLGGAAAELDSVLNRRSPLGPEHPHLFPQPRLAAGLVLRQQGIAHAAIDLSDGLSTDLAHLCEASHRSAEVELAKLPLHPLAERFERKEQLRLALHGGEDYELLFTASPLVKIPRRIGGVPVTRIGTILPRRRGQLVVTQIHDEGARSELVRGGWEHLR